MNTLIETPEFERAWGRIKDCHHSARGGGRPRHLRLFGQSGVGKTFIIDQYAESHPGKQLADRTTIPVLVVPLPAAPTLKAIYETVLKRLGAAGSGRVDELQRRAITLIRNLSVELLVLDEMNHVLDRGRTKTRESLTDSLKAFVDAIGIPTIFAGARRCTQLFDANAQLRSRATSKLTLRPFDLAGRCVELRSFIRTFLDGRLSPEQAQWMSSTEMATRHFYATDGIQRQLAEFLEAVPRWTPAQAINTTMFMELLADLFEAHLWEDAPASKNPYNPAFVMRRLNLKGEPYEPTELDGDNHFA